MSTMKTPPWDLHDILNTAAIRTRLTLATGTRNIARPGAVRSYRTRLNASQTQIGTAGTRTALPVTHRLARTTAEAVNKNSISRTAEPEVSEGRASGTAEPNRFVGAEGATTAAGVAAGDSVGGTALPCSRVCAAGG